MGTFHRFRADRETPPAAPLPVARVYGRHSRAVLELESMVPALSTRRGPA
jgi:hypothetical protein